MCHERRPRKGNESDDEAGASREERMREREREREREKERGRKEKGSERERGGRGSACKTLRASVSPRKVFKEKLRPDRNVSFAKMDGAVAPRRGWGGACSLAALYPLCQLEVGYRRIDTGFPLCLSLSAARRPPPLPTPPKAQYGRQAGRCNPRRRLASRNFFILRHPLPASFPPPPGGEGGGRRAWSRGRKHLGVSGETSLPARVVPFGLSMRRSCARADFSRERAT